jgi:transcription antitermination factor NusA-like protein
VIQQGKDPRAVLVDLGKVEAILPPTEQVPGERYVHGERLRCYVLHVRKGYRGPSITLSRTHPGLVKKLFSLEVPEIASGAVEIVAIAREAGHRTKIAVASHQPGVNAKGACIGPMGSRVRNVMTELHGEKIDIVDYSDDSAEFVANALSPARVSRVIIVDADARVAQVIVPDYQLSLAIGKEGQNARLAHKLTGWKIDIHGPEPWHHRRVSAVSLRPEWSGGPCMPGSPCLRYGRAWGARLVRPNLTCCAWWAGGMMFSPTRRRGYLVGAPMCIRARLASSKRNAAGHSAGRCACRGRP